jgi:hypothetical protein
VEEVEAPPPQPEANARIARSKSAWSGPADGGEILTQNPLAVADEGT